MNTNPAFDPTRARQAAIAAAAAAASPGAAAQMFDFVVNEESLLGHLLNPSSRADAETGAPMDVYLDTVLLLGSAGDEGLFSQLPN